MGSDCMLNSYAEPRVASCFHGKILSGDVVFINNRGVSCRDDCHVVNVHEYSVSLDNHGSRSKYRYFDVTSSCNDLVFYSLRFKAFTQV